MWVLECAPCDGHTSHLLSLYFRCVAVALLACASCHGLCAVYFSQSHGAPLGLACGHPRLRRSQR